MIEVIRPGQFSTIQDLGRFGYRSMGVPVSGPMDQASAAHANEILGNDPNDALIEMTYVGVTLLFHQSATISLAGAMCDIKVNNEPIEHRSILKIEAGSTIGFGAMKSGNFCYLAIIGGFKAEKTLGSACYYEAVNGKSRITKGARLLFDKSLQNRPINLDVERRDIGNSSGIIHVEKGPEFHLLSNDEVQLLTETEFTISPQSSRMGFRLNEQVNIESKEIVSSPVQPGTIQLTKGGQLIVLMIDAQTIGGYSRIFQLTRESIDILAQHTRNISFRFDIIET